MKTLKAIMVVSMTLFTMIANQGCGSSEKSENKNSNTSILTITPSAPTVLPNGSVQLSVSGGTAPYYYYINGGTSTGTINSSGYFTAGSANGTVTVQVQDSASHTGLVTITISSSASVLTISPSSTTVNYGSTTQFSASGGTAPYTYTVVSGASSGYVNPSTGLFTAYSTAGTVAIQVQDSAGRLGTATVTVTSGSSSSAYGYINAISKVFNTNLNACDFKIEWVLFESSGNGSVVLVSDTPTGPQSLFSCMDDHNGEAHSMQTGGTWPLLGSSATFKLYNASCPVASSNVVMSSAPVAQVTVTCTQ